MFVSIKKGEFLNLSQFAHFEKRNYGGGFLIGFFSVNLESNHNCLRLTHKEEFETEAEMDKAWSKICRRINQSS